MPNVFPACVGMNRRLFIRIIFCISVPRVCGDEPVIEKTGKEGVECSPRVWG